jgi:hypothetical protein
MGLALELIAGQATAPSTTATALTMGAGTSLTVRNAPLESRVELLAMWADVQGAGFARLRSPKLHDNVQGIRVATVVSEAKPLLPAAFRQPLVPQDQLIAELTGSATAGDIEGLAFLLFYENMPGTEARLLDFDTMMARAVSLVTVENTIATGTAGGFSGEEAINAEFDLLKANTDYALLGYAVSAECLCVTWRGVDSGNLRVGGPGDDTGRDYTRDWFSRLAREKGLPLIPTFNSANKGGILLDAMQDENGTDVTVTSIFAELAPARR